MTDRSPDEILKFWLEDVGPQKWWISDRATDEACERFMPEVERAARGELDHWSENAESALALILLLDQFPRNLFRYDPRAFATDAKALSHARQAVAKNLDLKIETALRQFFYLPFEHSENLADQEMCLALFEARVPDMGANTRRALEGHHRLIADFGRFPYRNAVLGRESTPQEQRYLDDPKAYRPGQKTEADSES